ncbi:STAS domain-containing protein [Adhaeribacter soli]|uniref:Anti-sigma factor antagonist n=1 Tax=Adhaeribacter soli TaxID=2607655 RepID=A0A5N1J9K0_9BACT|nr:STAS domain-containing protein [Adhaeribacter soli]KAA9345985.1 STAS domain-containing protein [Adhaeribacter soli]
MKIETEKLENISIVKLYGELDASNAVKVDQTLSLLISEKPSQIWIDGTQINYISSAGLGVFLSHLQTLAEEKIELLFFGLNTKIKHVFAILGLDTLIPIVHSREEAETYIAIQPNADLQEEPRKEA